MGVAVLAELLAGRVSNLDTFLDLVATDAVKPRHTVDHDVNASRIANWVAFVESAVCTPTNLRVIDMAPIVLLIITLEHVVGKFVGTSQAQTVLASIDLVAHLAFRGLKCT